MSGHSHFATIKHKKEQSDAKRGTAFSKLARLISVAAKDGPDPDRNQKLKRALEEAKKVNLPKDNIERAIKKGTGELGEERLEEFMFEGYGPGGIAVLIEGVTDNKNRSLGEVKQILDRNNGKLVGEGAVRWLFERKGVIVISSKNKEELELLAIEAGADDIYWHDSGLDVYTSVDDLEAVKKNLEGKGVKIEGASLDWVAKEYVSVNPKDKEAAGKLFELLDENDAVQDVYSNLAD